MGDMAEGWAEWREVKQKKTLQPCSVNRHAHKRWHPFQSNNNGIHLVLLKNEQFIDFWPSTGLWWIRGTSNKRRGIQKLINYMKTAS